MEWDFGLQGLGVLALLSLGFGILAQVIAARYTTHWLGLIAAAAYFICGLLISEAWFGWATEEELQPNIDGLSFDEVLLAWIPGIAALLVIRYVLGSVATPLTERITTCRLPARSSAGSTCVVLAGTSRGSRLADGDG